MNKNIALAFLTGAFISWFVAMGVYTVAPGSANSLTPDMTSTIQRIQQDLSSLESSVSYIKASISSIKYDVSNTNTDIKGIDFSISNIESYMYDMAER